MSTGWMIVTGTVVLVSFWTVALVRGMRTITDHDDSAEHEGATETSPPLAALAPPPMTDDDLRRERALADDQRYLDQAEIDLKPMIDSMHRALGAAFRAFDLATSDATQTTRRWHAVCPQDCQICAERDARVIGPVGPDRKIGLRGWREDTPTAEITDARRRTLLRL